MVKSGFFMKFVCPNCSRFWMSGKGVALLNFKAVEDGEDSYIIYYNVVVFGQECQRCETHGDKFVDDESLEVCAAKLAKYALDRLGYEYERAIRPDNGVETPPHKSELCDACKAGMCIDSLTQKMGNMYFR